MAADSSPEKAGTAAVADAASEADKNKVPVAAIAEERAKTRDAKAEAEAAKKELAKIKETGQIDLDLLNPVIERLAEEARKRTEEAIAPWKAKAEKAELQAKLGLNTAQVEAVMEVRSKNPTLNEQQAYLLARTEKTDLFPASRSTSGGWPVTGTSDSRNAPSGDDFVAKMNAATTADEKKHWAEQEILRRYRGSFERSKNLPR